MKRIAVAGSSGLVGSALVAHLRDRGDDVVRLVRRPPASADEITYDPDAGVVDVAGLVAGGPLDAVVNLAGAPVAGRPWTPAYRREIRSSRVRTTATLARVVAGLDGTALVNASAVGLYGDRPGAVLTERSCPAAGFLADVVAQWEAATRPAARAGRRVALVRTGIVLSPDGGALERLLPLVRAGLGGPLGSGRQVWPWITLADEVRAITHLVDSPVAGPVNLAAPAATSQLELTAALARRVGRTAWVPAPAPALRLALGGFAGELLASQIVHPGVLLASGFTFEHPRLHDAVSAVLGSPTR